MVGSNVKQQQTTTTAKNHYNERNKAICLADQCRIFTALASVDSNRINDHFITRFYPAGLAIWIEADEKELSG